MKIIVIGDGGHSKVTQNIIHSLKTHQLIGVFDDKYQANFEKQGILHAPISSLEMQLDQDVKVFVAIGNNSIRKKIVEALDIVPDQFVSIIHQSAIVSPTATIGSGTVVMPNVVINAESSIGEHCIINTGAIVEHENRIGSYAHISPNATLTGNVSIGEGVHIGASTTIIPGLTIGNWTIVGAGSTVIRDIPANYKVVGSPTRVIEMIKM